MENALKCTQRELRAVWMDLIELLDTTQNLDTPSAHWLCLKNYFTVGLNWTGDNKICVTNNSEMMLNILSTTHHWHGLKPHSHSHRNILTIAESQALYLASHTLNSARMSSHCRDKWARKKKLFLNSIKTYLFLIVNCEKLQPSPAYPAWWTGTIHNVVPATANEHKEFFLWASADDSFIRIPKPSATINVCVRQFCWQIYSLHCMHYVLFSFDINAIFSTHNCALRRKRGLVPALKTVWPRFHGVIRDPAAKKDTMASSHGHWASAKHKQHFNNWFFPFLAHALPCVDETIRRGTITL